MLVTTSLIVVFSSLVHFVLGFARLQPCDPIRWNDGENYNFVNGKLKMEVNEIKENNQKCSLTLQNSSQTYYYYGRKILYNLQSSKGNDFEYIVAVSFESSGESSCQTFTQLPKKALQFLAPTSMEGKGKITISALCGNDHEMYTAKKIVLLEQKSSTQTPSTIGTTTSEPVNTVYLSGEKFVLQYSPTIDGNGLHIKAQVLNIKNAYISFGIGSKMSACTVIMAMDPSINPGYKTLGLYQLRDRSSKPEVLISNDLSRFNIFNATYGSSAQGTILEFDLFSNSEFPLLGESAIDFIYAYGSSKFAYHINRGVLKQFRFNKTFSRTPTTITTLAPTTMTTLAPTTTSTMIPTLAPSIKTTTLTPNDSMIRIELDNNLSLFYKRSQTLTNFKLVNQQGGYIAFGKGKSMIDSSNCVVIGIESSSGLKTGLYHLQDYSENPQISIPSDGFQNITFSKTTSGSSILEFTIDLSLLSSSCEFLSPDANVKNYFMYAIGDDTWSYHSTSGVQEILLKETYTSSPTVVEVTKEPSFRFETSSTAPTNSPTSMETTITESSVYSIDSETKITWIKKVSEKAMMSIQLVRKKPGYLSLGIGKSMVNALVLIGCNDPSKPSIGLYELKDRSLTPDVLLASKSKDLFEQFGISDASFFFNSSVSILRFTYSLNHPSRFRLVSNSISSDNSSPVDMVFAASSSSTAKYGMHTKSKVFSLNLQVQQQQPETSAANPLLDKADIILILHVLFMILAWNLISPIGIYIMANKISASRKFHRILQLTSIGSCFLGFGLIIWWKIINKESHFSRTHDIMGILVIGLSIIQANLHRLQRISIHIWFGYITITLAFVATITGLLELLKNEKLISNLVLEWIVVASIACGITLISLSIYAKKFQKKHQFIKAAINSDFSFEEVQTHNKNDDCYVIFEGKVIDVTRYLTEHPGGSKIILKYGGQDISQVFADFRHSKQAKDHLERMVIGTCKKEIKSLRDTIETKITIPWEDIMTLKSKTLIGTETFEFVFKTSPKVDLNNFSIGKHVIFTTLDRSLSRTYTPTNKLRKRHLNDNEEEEEEENGILRFMIKLLPNGAMSSYLDHLKPGDQILGSGPIGNVEYLDNGLFFLSYSSTLLRPRAESIIMIAGGTGIAPMLQILRNSSTRITKTHYSLFFFAKTLGHFAKLDQELPKEFPNVSMWFFTSNTIPNNNTSSSYSDIVFKSIDSFDASRTIFLLSGPDGMIDCLHKSFENCRILDL